MWKRDEYESVSTTGNKGIARRVPSRECGFAAPVNVLFAYTFRLAYG